MSRLLEPVINDPHGGRFAAQARALLAGKSENEAEAAGASAPEEEAPTAPPGTGQPAEAAKTKG